MYCSWYLKMLMCWKLYSSTLESSTYVDRHQAKDRSNPPEGSIVTTSMVRVAGKRNVPNCDFSRHIKCRNFWPYQLISPIFGSMSISVMRRFQRTQNLVFFHFKRLWYRVLNAVFGIFFGKKVFRKVFFQTYWCRTIKIGWSTPTYLPMGFSFQVSNFLYGIVEMPNKKIWDRGLRMKMKMRMRSEISKLNSKKSCWLYLSRSCKAGQPKKIGFYFRFSIFVFDFDFVFNFDFDSLSQN